MSISAAGRVFLTFDLQQQSQILTIEDKDLRETNSSEEAVGTRQLRWQGKFENVTSPFALLGVKGFGNSWG